MSNLTDIAMKAMENDTQLVSTLYRTHKSLPPTAKVSSLYVFDALSRAAKHHANKHGVSGDSDSGTSNCATFLLKIESVLEGLFEDMMTVGSSEAKWLAPAIVAMLTVYSPIICITLNQEKSKKVLEIWLKGSTFPPQILARLSSLLEEEKQVPKVPTSTNIIADPRPAAAQSSLTPTPTPTPLTTPPVIDAQATLLALLAQAAQAAAIPAQTTTSMGDAAQLAVLQQLALAQKANSGTPSQPPQVLPLTVSSQSAFPSHRDERSYSSHKDPRLKGHQSSDRVNAYVDQPEERPSYRGGHRGGLRGRGRGGGRWDDRDRDRNYQERDDRHSPRRQGRSRSRSPSRPGDRRDLTPHSPPRRPPLASVEYHGRGSTDSRPLDKNDGKDEFGRDIRSQSPDGRNTHPTYVAHSPRPTTTLTSVPTTVSNSTSQSATEPIIDSQLSAQTSNHDQMSLPPLIAANTSSSLRSAHVISSTASAAPGLESFNPMTFDFTSPTSWEALGKLWQITKGYMPSTEELAQFVMTSGQSASFMQTTVQGSVWENTSKYPAGRGRGGFSRGRGGFYHNTHNIQDGPEHYSNHDTDAVVLGGDSTSLMSPSEIMHVDNNSSNKPQIGGAAGKMQRVGDKWVFVREPVSI
ncbi:hypothetical protein H0H93_003550 [Arthromyces matolae]|nr:hypothetical protein H0H93_003550 [Arthromyces matolae]